MSICEKLFNINEVFEISTRLAYWVLCKHSGFISAKKSNDLDADFIGILRQLWSFNDGLSQFHCFMVLTKKKFDEIAKECTDVKCWELIDKGGIE